MLSFELHSLGVSLFVVLYDLCFLFIWGSVPVDLGGFVLLRYARSINVYEPCFAGMTQTALIFTLGV